MSAPKQNRVTPFGEIVAVRAQGMFMGNRGLLHDEHQQIRRLYKVKAWIICVLEFKERRREVMSPGLYTELFFLDEATGLAAGHRPCAECQRTRFNEFRTAWAAANPDLAGSDAPLVNVIDTVLHRERITADKHKVTYHSLLADLPEGTFVSIQHQPYLVQGDWLRLWTPHGYTDTLPRPDVSVEVLTPRSIVRTLAHGYSPKLHDTANEGR